jgi:predicted RNA methylase
MNQHDDMKAIATQIASLQQEIDVWETGTPKQDKNFKSELGQFMTPPSIANFMAEILTFEDAQEVHILDAGAGMGALTCAALDALGRNKFQSQSVAVTAFEIDPGMLQPLEAALSRYNGTKVSVHSGDYIHFAATQRPSLRFTHAILNPPYKKISSQSEHRKMLRSVGIETTNLYSAFVALAVRELTDQGELVAIIPRSFCNGPYFKPFRELLLDQVSIKQIHLFRSRSEAFKEDNVLQENIIISLQKGVSQGEVVISTSNDGTFSDIVETTHPFENIVNSADLDRFINIPTEGGASSSETITIAPATLEEVGVSISTGPVVGFRLKEHLREEWDRDSAPLIYPSHLKNHRAQWPLSDGKKPNAIHQNDQTSKWLYPNGYYCVVRRFSSKEERHRIVASVVSPDTFPSSKHIGLDNKLNVFHQKKAGLTREMAIGLCAFLNTDMVDEAFRLFSGHTQVNATDLRRMRYPSAEKLEKLGAWALTKDNLSQEEIYAQLGAVEANE